ncbi:MAG TPA: dihydrofolate reductase family protein [Thermoanaerobaculia bacterium]|nr:dihydrofolate reductase family protein [Thermoanaerobaculia bacterium]
MKRARRIVVSIAVSADGYIARPDGDFSWLDRPRPKGNYGMNAFLRSIDTVLWGRKTYEIGLKFGGANLGLGPGFRNYVFSRKPPKKAPAGATFVRGSIRAFARRLRREPGKDVWIMGGASLIASFLDAGQIDAFSIFVIPVFIGSGIPLAAPRRRLLPLKLRAARPFPDGVVKLEYDVRRGDRQSK